VVTADAAPAQQPVVTQIAPTRTTEQQASAPAATVKLANMTSLYSDKVAGADHER
jgi:hypothetical protein